MNQLLVKRLFTRLHRKALLLLIALGVLFALTVGVAYAFTVGSVDGTWGTIDTNGAECDTWATGPGSNPTAYSTSSTTVQGNVLGDENQVRYGDPQYDDCPGGDDWKTEFAKQSGFGFDGVNGPVSPAANTPFFLGRFYHYNYPIYADNPFLYVNITTVVPITCNDGVTSTNFTFTTRYDLDETSNSTPCAYPGSTVCPDKVTITQPATSSFTCPDGDYTVNILGFTKENASDPDCSDAYNPSNTSTEYVTEEQATNRACLWAEITAPTANIAPEKTCADYNLVDPFYTIEVTNAGPGSARQAQITDTMPTGVVLTSPLVYTSQLTTIGGTVNQGSCSVSGQTVTCQLLTSLPATTVDPNARWTVTIHTTINDDAVFPLSNTVNASMGTTDTNPANNTDTCISDTPTNATMASFSASAVDQSILVTWETLNEQNILNFNLYRSESVDGVRSLLQGNIAPQFAGENGASAVYEYPDAAVTPGVTYFYWLEVHMRGQPDINMGPTSALVTPQHNHWLFLPALGR